MVFWVKNIFPFGNDFISWGDMHTQILALYYNFYDAIYNGKSFLIDFTSGTAFNLLSNFSYYIMSPFTLIILFFERIDIPQAVSLIVLGKMVLSAITCNLFLDKKFDKLNDFYKCFFSILYALSTYNLSLYIITGWIDIVYLFPLLLLGLDKLLNKEKVTLFIIILSFCLIFNFYIALMCIVFIFFASLIYLLFYNIDNKKRKVTLLGISVVLSVLISSVILIPTMFQILSSARMGFNFTELFDSKTGPIIDKFIFLTSSSAMISCILLLFKNYKSNKKWILFFLSIAFLVASPLIVEPINKMLHFGSYVYYPYRYGFIFTFLLIMGACYYLNQAKEKNKIKNIHSILIYASVIVCNVLVIVISYYFYHNFQVGVDKLTFSADRFTFFMLVLLVVLNFIPYLIIFALGKKNSKSTYICLMINLIIFSFTQSMIYIKIDHDEKELHSVYNDMNYIYELDINDNYHFKQQEDILIYNYGSVIGKPSLDFFTSLTDNNMFLINQKLGYNSMWMDTSSVGSNYFVDFILSNKYLITSEEFSNDLYKLKAKINDLYLYETVLPISKGYITKENISIENSDNSFDATNSLYKAFSNTDEDIIDIYDEFNFVNVSFEDDQIKIIDDEKEAYLEISLSVKERKTLYFEAMTSYLSSDKSDLYDTFDIYINDELVMEKYPNIYHSNSLNLGEFNNSNLNIKIIVNNDAEAFSIKLGLLDQSKLKSYFNNNLYDVDIEYDRNKIKINYDSDNENLLFVPITYLDGMSANNNNENISIVRMFDNFIGIRLNEGQNDIVISYTTPGLKLGSLMSMLGIVLTILFIKFSKNIISINIINNISYCLYLILYVILSIIFYILPFGLFILSYF